MPRKTAKRTGAGKRYPLNMRTTKEVRDLLEREAAQSGRSLAQEVEHRIQSSLRDDLLFRALSGPNAEPVIRPILGYLNFLETQGILWKDDPAAASAMREAIGIIMEAVLSRPLSKERVGSIIGDINRRYNTKTFTYDKPAAGLILPVFVLLERLGLAELNEPQASTKAENESGVGP